MKTKSIKLNGVTYVPFNKYKELQSKKVKIKTKVITKEVEKEVEKINLKDYYIMDPANVACICPIIKNNVEVKDVYEISIGCYKKVESPKIVFRGNSLVNKDTDVCIIQDSKYSTEYINKIIKMGSFWFDEEPLIYMMYDKQKEEFLKDSPVMFIFGDKLCFLLAPRVESE